MDPIAAGFVLARTIGLVLTAPGFAAPGLDPRFRLVLAGALASIVAPVVGPGIVRPAGGFEVIAWTALGELAAGAGLGLAAGLILAGARQAGEIVGAQAGLSAAALFDPDAAEEMTPMGHLYGLIALGAFLALDGPLELVRGLMASYETLPVGGGLDVEAASRGFAQVGAALALAVRAAAPAAIALTLAGIAVGLAGRASASLSGAATALPVRFAVGLAIALLGAAAVAATFAAAWQVGPLASSGGG